MSHLVSKCSRIGTLWLWLALLSMLLAGGCGGGSDGSFSLDSPTGGPQAAPITRVTVTPKDDAPVTQRIGRQGGTVALTTADGTRYQLAIPPLALLGDTDITLTAVDLQGLPVSGRVLGAVRMGPSGLKFLRGAKLTITPAQPFVRSEFIPLGMGDAGEDLALLLGQAFADRIELLITHFSVAGGAAGTPEEATNLGSRFTSPTQQAAEQAIAEIVLQAYMTGASPQDRRSDAEAIVRGYFAIVKHDLDSAQTNQACEAAIQQYAGWQALLDLADSAIGGSPPLCQAERQQGRNAAILALRAAVDRVFESIRQRQDWHLASQVSHFSLMAESIGLLDALPGDLSGPGLDQTSLAARLPVQIIVEPGPYVPAIIDDPPATVQLHAKAVLAVVDAAGNPIRTLPIEPIDVQVSMTGANSDHVGGQTDVNQGPDQNVYRTPISLGADSAYIRGQMEFTFPPIGLPIQTTVSFRGDGKLFMAAMAGPGSVQPGETVTITLPLLRKGTKRLAGEQIYFQVLDENLNPVSESVGGSLSPNPASTQANGSAVTAYTAPFSSGRRFIRASYSDAGQTVVQTLPLDGIGIAGNWAGTYTGTWDGVCFMDITSDQGRVRGTLRSILPNSGFPPLLLDHTDFDVPLTGSSFSFADGLTHWHFEISGNTMTGIQNDSYPAEGGNIEVRQETYHLTLQTP